MKHGLIYLTKLPEEYSSCVTIFILKGPDYSKSALPLELNLEADGSFGMTWSEIVSV